MGWFDFTNKNKSKNQSDKLAEDLFAHIAKQMQFANNNEFAKQVMKVISDYKSIPLFEYNTKKFIEEGYIRNHNVFAVVNLIAGPTKNINWKAYEVKDKGRKKALQQLTSSNSFDIIEYRKIKSRGFEEVQDEKNILVQKIEGKINEYQSFKTFIHDSIIYYLTTGNDFTYKYKSIGDVGNENVFARSLYTLPAQSVEIKAGDMFNPIAGYSIFGNMYNGEFNPNDIIHLKTFNTFAEGYNTPENLLYGLSPLAPLCRIYQRSNQATEASLAMLVNGFPKGLLSTNTNEYSLPMNNDDVLKFQEQWVKRYGGGRKANIPLIAPTDLKWIPMGLKAGDLELELVDQNSLKSIARVYNVPEPLLLADNSSYNNMDTARKDLWENAIIPALAVRRDSLNDNWVNELNNQTGKSYWIDFDLSNVKALQQDQKALSERVVNEYKVGLHTGNEVRYVLGYDVNKDDSLLNQKVMESTLKYVDVDKIPEKYKTFISVINSVSPLVANNIIGAMTENELRELVNAGVLPEGQMSINQLIATRGQGTQEPTNNDN